MTNENVSKYNLEYCGVKCTGVEWENYIFYFEYLGKEYVFEQSMAISASADTDHIRIVIEEQFLPFVKDLLKTEQVRKDMAKEVLQEYTQQLIEEFKESGEWECNTTVARVLKNICPEKVNKIFRRYAKQYGVELDGNND